jgi:Xaa-Pro aminopeptidase
MKRGLVVLDDAEISAAERGRRVRELQERLSAQGVDIGLVYGDVYRSDDIGYLTNLCIYWNEGVLAVPAEGEPVFLTKLSPRVHGWMRRTSTVSELRSGRGFGTLAQELRTDGESGVIGLVDARRWPAAVVDDIAGALPGWELRLLGDLVRDQRLIPSRGELALLRTAGRVIGRAAGRAGGPGLTAAARVALVERELRGAGFADVLVASETTGDGVVSVEITGQYRQGWLRAARLVDAGGGTPWTATLRAALAAAIDAAVAGAPVSAIPAAAAPVLANAKPPPGTGFDVTWINQADLSTNGEYERHAAPARLPEGTVGVVSVEALFPGGGRAVLADTVLVDVAATRRLTVPTDEVAGAAAASTDGAGDAGAGTDLTDRDEGSTR